MKRIILTFSLILCGLALFSQIPRIRLNQIQKDTVWGSVLISSPVDSNLTYSRDFYIGPDTSLNFYGTVLVAGGGGGGSFVTTTILSDSLANYILKVAGFGGDVSGTYDNITVIDDSHNHIISNVDGLQTALDGKLTSVNAGYGLSGSGTSASALLVDTSGTIVSKNFYFGNLPAGGGGTVTSVSAGTQISGMSMTISNPTTTPSIATSISDAANFRTAIGAGTLSSEVDGSVTNEGTLGVSAGTASTSVITSNTSGANGVTITAAGINSISESTSSNGGTITITATEVDGSISNEGSLSVGAGGANSSDIVSNTSGSTNVTIAGSGAVTVTESGSTITISATGGGSSFNNLTETADTMFVAKYLNVDTSTLYVDAINNRVGIGTTAPLSKFHIAQEASTTNALARIGTHTVQPFAVDNIVYGTNTFYNADSVSYVAIETGRVAWFQQNFGSSIFRGSIDVNTSGNVVTNQVTSASFTPFGLNVKPLGNSVNPTTSTDQYNYYNKNYFTVLDSFFVLDTFGNVGIEVATPTETLDVNGNARFRVIGNATRTGALSYTSTGVLTTNTSDIRLKTNLQPIESVLNFITEFKPYTFNWINDPNINDFGFIAQDVEQIFPLLVFENQGMKGVHYDKLGVLAIKAIQEQQAIIETQQQEIEQLKTQYNDLLQRIIQLENK